MTSKQSEAQETERSFLRSALTDQGSFLSLDEFFAWFRLQSAKAAYEIVRIPFAALQDWQFQAGRLVHASGKFFSIEGLRIETDFGPVPVWDQPIINQPEIGILGIISQVFNGSRHFLMQAKMEPGTVNYTQLAPTLQATRSNLTRVHKGRTPLYLEYFTEPGKSRVLIDQLQSEQASRFLFKRNRNMIVEVEGDVPVHDGFCWLTLGQIKNLLLYNNTVNMDARTVLSCIPYCCASDEIEGTPAAEFAPRSGSFATGLYRSLFAYRRSRHGMNEILSWLTNLRWRYQFSLRTLPLNDLNGWMVTDTDIHHAKGEYFSVIAAQVRAEGREVTSWTQPLLDHPGQGLNGFVLQRIDGLLHLLVRACLYPGNRETFELGPTVSRSNYRKQFGGASQPHFLDLFRNPPPEQVRYAAVQSEEGGRFFRYQNHYVVLEIPETERLDLPGNFMWMTLAQVQELVRHGYFNIEARNLLACLNLLAADGQESGLPAGGVRAERAEERRALVANGSLRKYSKEALPSQTFCILPWTHLFADELGVLYPCCFGLDANTPNIDASGQPHVVYSAESVQQGWNSAFMRNIRKDMLQGRRPEACRLCFQYEDLGMTSYRQNSNEDYNHAIQELAELDPDGHVAPDFRSVDLRLGNICNLRCRMCSPKSSKGLIAEWTELLQIDPRRLDKFNRVDWYARPEVWQLIEKYSPQIERLIFAGGEPLLVRQHFDFLERLIVRGEAGRVHLSYITNATMLPAQIYDTWPHFRSVRLVISLDGFGPVNEFIRYPTKWEELDRNLHLLDENAAKLNLREMGFNTTVQVYNVLSLTELFEYTFQFRRIKPYPDLSILNLPGCFSIQILPPELKRQVAEQFAAFRQRYDARWPEMGRKLDQFQRDLDGVVDHMMAKDRQAEIPEFVKRNAVFDAHRSQSARLALPALASLFSPASSILTAAGGGNA